MMKRQIGRFTVSETAGSGQHRPYSFEIRRSADNTFIEGNERYFASAYAAMQAGSKQAQTLEMRATASEQHDGELHHLYGRQQRSPDGKATVTVALCGEQVPDHLTHSRYEIKRKRITCIECYIAWLND